MARQVELNQIIYGDAGLSSLFCASFAHFFFNEDMGRCFLVVLNIFFAIVSCSSVVQHPFFFEGSFDCPPIVEPCSSQAVNYFNVSQVKLTVSIVSESDTVKVNGFYFGNTTFRVRYRPGRNFLAGSVLSFAPVWSGLCVPNVVGPSSSVKLFVPFNTSLLPLVATRNQSFVFLHQDNNATSPTFFFPVGLNIAWGLSNFSSWFHSMSNAVSQSPFLFRLWLGPYPWDPLQMENQMSRVGHYDLTVASLIDSVLMEAAKVNAYAVVSFHTFSEFVASNPELGMLWPKNPYNVANGGPCASPRDWFQNPVAKSFQRQLYHYIVARYGAFANVFSWEFFNEVDLVDQFDPSLVYSWHEEMYRHVLQIDSVHHHMITTSFSDHWAPYVSQTFQNLFHYSQQHRYEFGDDISTQVQSQCQQMLGDVPSKPAIFGEFGIATGSVTLKMDPNGLSLHCGLWGSVLSLCGASVQSWWWDIWIDAYHLWSLFSPIQNAVSFLSSSSASAMRTVLNATTSDPFAEALALQSGQDRVVVWMHNLNFTWSKALQHFPLNPIHQLLVKLHLPSTSAAGLASIQFFTSFNTTQLISTTSQNISNGVLTFECPSFTTDIAAHISI